MKTLIVFMLTGVVANVNADEIRISDVPRIETIYAVDFASSSLKIRVQSNGCTTKNSFLVEKQIDRDNLVHLRFVRIHPDWCKAYYSRGVVVEFSKQDLNIFPTDMIKLENPLGANFRN